MINANELRIGNWVKVPAGATYSPKSIVKVATIGNTGINSWRDMGMSGEAKFEDIQSIPLTPEILEKAGFGRPRMRYEYQSWFYPRLDKYILCRNEVDDYITYLVYRSRGNEPVELHVSHSQYLHQLQNLYFALTGEELKIEL